jgi:hypothetical protein
LDIANAHTSGFLNGTRSIAGPKELIQLGERSKFVHDGAPGPRISKEVEARRKFAFTKTGPPAVRPFGLYRLPADRIRIG